MSVVRCAVVLAALALASAQQCNVSTGVVIGQGSVKGLKVSDAAACCAACFAYGYGCAAFTFEAGASADASTNCFLKGDATGRTLKPGATSGTTGGGPAPPPSDARNRTLATRACRPEFASKPWCDTTKPLGARVDALIAEIQDSEIPPLLTAREGGGGSPGPSGAIERIGLPEYDWGVNCIHGVQTTCAADDTGKMRCPTSFPNPVSLGTSFNASMYREMGSIIGRELRALWLVGATEASSWSGRPHAGLDCWSPNININRDPRWGRNQEVPGEDPFLNGVFGTQYTQGLQEGEDSRYTQVIVTLKHWDAYSLEDSDGFTRHNFNAVVDNQTLADTYWPAFKATVQEGKALGVMCSYNAINSVPTCASKMLNSVLRDSWGFDGYVTSDTGAVNDIYTQHKYVKTAEEAVAAALRDGGCDIDSGAVYHDALLNAVQQGLLSKDDVHLALHRTLKLRFQLGLFDPVEGQPLWAVPSSIVGSDDHQAINLLSTLESLVLLQNNNSVLPIRAGARVALIGPHGNATKALVGNYLGQLCPGGGNDFSCVQGVADAMKTEFAALTVVQGSDISKPVTGGVDAAVAAAKAADVVVLAVGIDNSVESESHDRTDTALPSPQQDLLSAVTAVGKPTVAVLINGGMINLETIKATCHGILSCGYPGFHGAAAIASTLAGKNDHLGGKLAYTVYPDDYVTKVKMSDMSMRPSATSPGRSYKWFKGTPVFPFGYGISLTTFTITNTSSFCGGAGSAGVVAAAGEGGGGFRAGDGPTQFSAKVTNTGARAGDEVVFGYFSPPGEQVKQQLFGFQRVHLAPGESKTVTIGATEEAFAVAEPNGDLVVNPGNYEITLTNGNDQVISCTVVRSAARRVVAPFPVK